MEGSATTIHGKREQALWRKGPSIWKNDENVYDYTAPTAGRWFSIFMLGAKRIMVVVRRQDKALTVDQLL